MSQATKVGVGVGVLILRGGEVLLGLRHTDKDKADSALHGEGTWTMPGGSLEMGENLEDCAAREVEEETGIKIRPEDLSLISIANDRVEDAHFVTIGFLTEEFEGEAEILEPDKITEWQWFNIDKLPDSMFFPSREMIENYKDGAIYRSPF